MLAQFCVHLILIFISTPIPLISGECIADANKCLDKFSYDLENHKKFKFENLDQEHDHICNPNDGLFHNFVECINDIGSHCSSNNNFVQTLCDRRILKLRISRFSWKPTFFYNLCHNSDRQLSQDIIKHETCISDVLNANSRNWKCDQNYYNVIKKQKVDFNTTCSLWQKFRDCTKRDVQKSCDDRASYIADHLLHSHQSYFTKYSSCNLEGISNDQCWYDLMKGTVTTAQTLTTTSTFGNPIETKTDSIKTNTIAINDNTIPTQESDVQTLKDSQIEEKHRNSDQKSGQLIEDIHQSETTPVPDLKAEESIQSDNSKLQSPDVSPESKASSVQQTKEQKLITSGAKRDSIADKYLMIVPIILILIIKLFV